MSRDLRRMYRTAVSAEDLPENMELKLVNMKSGETTEATITFHKKSWPVEGKEIGLRYGTNPHQAAAFYVLDAGQLGELYFGGMRLLKSGKNGLSATNVEDGYRALRIVDYFEGQAAAAVMKHLNPSGVGTSSKYDKSRFDEEIMNAENLEEDLVGVFEKAWSGDPRAAYGSVVGFNVPVGESVAENIIETEKYVECLFAPSFSSEALELLEKKKDIRIVEVPRAELVLDEGLPYEIKMLGDSLLLEHRFSTKLRTLEALEDLNKDEKAGAVTKRYPTEQEKLDMLRGWWVCCEKRSNGVVIWKNDKVLSVGTGQQDRIGAIEIVLARAKRVGHDLKGSVLASDGFMLWDNVDPLAEAGVSAIIQPGGSVDDKHLIKQCDDYDIAMTFTGERAFRHF